MTEAIVALETRGSLIENRHVAWAIGVNVLGRVFYESEGARSAATFFRSTAKPYQALPLVEEGYHQQLSLQELALVCASHGGSEEHLIYVASILEKAGVDASALQCGPHLPLDPAIALQLQCDGREPGKYHNNCSGKHAGMLLYCKLKGEPLETYLDPEHPLQQRILSRIRQDAGLDEVAIGIDGCGAPVMYLPLEKMALLYAKLSMHSDFVPIISAMTTYPHLVGDAGRIDSVLMQVTQGRLLVKVGADGVIGFARIGQGEGLMLKVADGNNAIRDLLVLPLLETMGWLTAEELNHPKLASFRDTVRRNTQNIPVGALHVQMPEYSIIRR